MLVSNPASGRDKGSRRGTILMTVIIVLVFLAVMGMSLLGLLFSRISITMLDFDRLKAFYLAEAGIAKSINELRYDVDYDGNGVGNISKMKLGDGMFWVKHNLSTSTITATGESNNVERTIQIKYSVF